MILSYSLVHSKILFSLAAQIHKPDVIPSCMADELRDRVFLPIFPALIIPTISQPFLATLTRPLHPTIFCIQPSSSPNFFKIIISKPNQQHCALATMGEFTSYYASGGESEGERERVYDERKDIVDEKQEDQAHDEYSDEPLDSDDPPAPQNTSSGTHTPYNGMSPYDDPKTIHHSPNMRQLHHKLEILRLEQQNDEAAQNPSPPTYGSNTCEATTPVPDEHPIPQPQDELEGYEEISPTCSTSVLCISDTHGGDFKIPPNRVDVLLLSGDILAHAHDNICSQYLSTIDRLNEANAGLKLVIAGNHDAPMDLEYFKDKSRRLPRRQEKKKLVRMLAENHIKYLDEGRYEFTLENGARLKIYVSPFTVKREQSWRAFVYTRHQGHCLYVYGFPIPHPLEVVPLMSLVIICRAENS